MRTVTEVEQQLQAIDDDGFPQAIPEIPLLPMRPAVSGLYVWSRAILPTPIPIAPPPPLPTRPGIPEPIPRVPGPGPGPDGGLVMLPPLVRETLRLDVDGRYPEMVASGTVMVRLFTRLHWIANLTSTETGSWVGTIWYKDGDSSSFPFTNVEIQATRGWFPNQRSATVTFSGGGATRVRTYAYRSRYFHPVEFEFDCATGESATLSIDTCAHPNRPASEPCETLTIDTVFRRAGFDVTRSGGDTLVPIGGAGTDARWSDLEMHDAMQVYWSRFANAAQWSMWTFFASLHEMGTSLGGIMYDDIGQNHRQGCAIFNDSFISQAPAGDPAPAAWVQRMNFWTACHEMGHCFNLAHSWQKSMGTSWIPLADEPEARSFMNYPYYVAGGQAEFFEDFEFRFSDSELLFLRHAPERFVQMGNADWFDNHGFQQARVYHEPLLGLELRVNRAQPVFEFMEPVVVELKLTNISSDPQLIDENLLSAAERMVLIVKKDGKPARRFVPYARYCLKPSRKVIAPHESVYDSMFISAGLNGCDLAEPGLYTIQVALALDDEDLVSNPLRLRVAPPMGHDEEFIAQDYFEDDVGRILAFDGSRVLDRGNDVLREVSERLSDRRVTIHARVALGNAAARECKTLDISGKGAVPASAQVSAQAAGAEIKISGPDPDEAQKQLTAALIGRPDVAAESLGHIDYRYYVDGMSNLLAKRGDASEAARTQDVLYETLSARGVLPRVLDEIKGQRDSYGKARSQTRRSS